MSEERNIGVLHEIATAALGAWGRWKKHSATEKAEIVGLLQAMAQIELGREAREARAKQDALYAQSGGIAGALNSPVYDMPRRRVADE